MTYNLTYLSLGMGTQSWAMAAMAALGVNGVPRPDCAIFSDTGDEIADTYRDLEFAEKWLAERGIPVYRVSAGTTLAAAAAAAVSGLRRLNGNQFFVSLPLFVVVPEHEVLDEDGIVVRISARVGVLRRQCTNEFKLVPIRRKVRELLGIPKGKPAKDKTARALIGISLEEAVMRIKPSRDRYITNTYPLVDAKLTRFGCAKFLEEQKLPVPTKSACRMCPYHDDHYWRWLKTERRSEFEEACKFDEMVRDLSRAGVKYTCFVHPSCVPLRDVDFEAGTEPNQARLFDMASFRAECLGMCGT